MLYNVKTMIDEVSIDSAIQTLMSTKSRDITGKLFDEGRFIENPVPFNPQLRELRKEKIDFDVPETSPIWNEELIETMFIQTDQRLVVREKVRSIILNYDNINKPIVVAHFEESPFSLVLNGNHRLSAAKLLGKETISAFVLDIRESFF